MASILSESCCSCSLQGQLLQDDKLLFYQWIPWSHDHECTHTSPSVWCELSMQTLFSVHYIPVERIFQKIVFLVHNLWVIKAFKTHNSSSFCGWTFGPSVQNVDYNSLIFYHHNNFIYVPIVPVQSRQWWWLTRIYWPSNFVDFVNTSYFLVATNVCYKILYSLCPTLVSICMLQSQIFLLSIF